MYIIRPKDSNPNGRVEIEGDLDVSGKLTVAGSEVTSGGGKNVITSPVTIGSRTYYEYSLQTKDTCKPVQVNLGEHDFCSLNGYKILDITRNGRDGVAQCSVNNMGVTDGKLMKKDDSSGGGIGDKAKDVTSDATGKGTFDSKTKWSLYANVDGCGKSQDVEVKCKVACMDFN